MPTCPKCHSEERQVKAGRNYSGSQKYRCQGCGKKYTPDPAPLRYPQEMREQAVRLYLAGMSFRAIGRRLGVNHQSVINWINDYAVEMPRLVGRWVSRRAITGSRNDSS